MSKDKNNVWILCLKDKVMLRRNKAIVAQNDTTLLSTNCYCSSHKLFISEQLFWHVCNMFQECWKFFALFAATATTPLYNVYIVYKGNHSNQIYVDSNFSSIKNSLIFYKSVYRLHFRATDHSNSRLYPYLILQTCGFY